MLAATYLILLPFAAGLVGYDCGGEGLNITTLSLLDIGTCNVEDIEPRKEETYIQLMQLSEYDKTTVMQCRVEVDRTVYYCGMSSHVSIVHNGRREYLQEIGERACSKLHDSGTITIANAVMDRIAKNTTNIRSVTLVGSTTVDGKCSGAQYTDGYGTWENVVVQASIRITLRTFEASIKRSEGNIYLPTGAHCQIANGYCLDSEGSETYWSPLPVDSCHFDRYDILYEGLGTKLTPKANQTTPTIYTVTTRDTTFALTKTTDFSLCGYRLTQTEHPKLFILETTKGRTFKTQAKITVDNLDIFSYVNSKFVYVEKHIKTQLTQLYRDIMEQKCALEQQILQNALSLASIAPDEMAYRIMKGPGYTAVTTGEAVHLIKCVPVDCKVRHTEQCYSELPVTHRNTSLFLLPRSRILTRKGTPRDCSDFLPVMFKIHGTWFRLTPKLTESLAPPVIQPLTHPNWHYINPTSLADGGIYRNEDLDRLRTHIMFPVERPSTLNTIARGAMGGNIPVGSISMINLLDEESLSKIAESTGKRVWKGFITFGSASAGVLAIFIIIRVVKLIIDTVIHGYALHSVYGWSMHLLGAVWSSVTHLLLHIGGRPGEVNATQEEEAADNDPKPPALNAEPRLDTNPQRELRNCNANVGKPHYSYVELRQYLNETQNKDNPA